MPLPRSAFAALCAVLVACSPTEPDEPGLVIEPGRQFYQPLYDNFSVLPPIRIYVEIDVVVRNVSHEAISLDRCVPSDTMPSFTIRSDNGQNSPLVADRVCITTPPYVIPAGEQRTFAFLVFRELDCDPGPCLSYESKTSGYHRLVLSSDVKSYASRRFYLYQPSHFISH